jgi:aspartate kinase
LGYNPVSSIRSLSVAILVQKYGGSSVADIDKIKLVAERVVGARSAGNDVVVVVSAMGKTTDGLLALAKQINPTPSSRELDMLLTVGERITMALLSMAIQSLGVDAISFTGSQCGILTNASHSRARIVEIRPFRVLDELEAGRVVIVAGFQGVSYRREITTLGRGGSDTTAVALAAALDAERCEIYSDIDAVHSADPKVALDAKRLSEVTYDEMLALSRHGAKVLNAEAVEFARQAGIAVFTRSTFAPDLTGTIVRANPPPEPRPVTGVASRKGVVAVEVRAHPGIREAVTTILRAADLAPDFVLGGPGPGAPVLFVFSESTNVGLESMLAEALGPFGDSARVIRELGTVTVVGDVMIPDEVRRDFLACLQGLPEPAGIVATPTATTVLVAADCVDETVRRLHSSCVTGKSCGTNGREVR